MRLKQTKSAQSEAEEQRLAEELTSLVQQDHTHEDDPAPDYWRDLHARTNRTLDEAASGKAISISWAARVAIPGVVAIIFFFIGLHYYVPERAPASSSVKEMILALGLEEQDSLVVEMIRSGAFAVDAAFYDDVFTQSTDETVRYLVAAGWTNSLVATLSDDEAEFLLDRLRSRKGKSF